MINAFIALVLLAFTQLIVVPASAAEITFDQADINYDQVSAIPPLGWGHVSLPLRVAKMDRLINGSLPKFVWLRLTFDRKQIEAGDAAISIAQSGGRTDAFMNTVPFFQASNSPINENLATFQPLSLAVPETLLHAGENNIVLRITLDEAANIAAAGIRIGRADEIRKDSQWKYLFQYIGPMLASSILVLMSVFVFFFWFMRRDEKILLWLALFSLFSAISGLQFVFNHQPFAPDLLQSIFFSASLLLFPTIIGIGNAFYHNSYRSRLANGGVTVAILIVALSVLHDLGVNADLWFGIGIPLSPYGDLILAGVLGAVIGQRFVENLNAKESQNDLLNSRIETTKANLIVSETARRTLEVSNAITSERARMMREIHDGIGSSLIAALASAERQGKKSTTAVVALKSALTDLRIAVDSLEPAEGNVTTLLASLRYRLEPELQKSGIAFEWQVDEVPELNWLDPQNALHILRIFQEALGNTLGHANASKITVGCKLGMDGGRPGIVIEVKDNGDGFDSKIPPQGRGRKNMLQRAESLGGKLAIESEPGRGARTTLWLPLIR